jgi:hypothetical protein
MRSRLRRVPPEELRPFVWPVSVHKVFAASLRHDLPQSTHHLHPQLPLPPEAFLLVGEELPIGGPVLLRPEHPALDREELELVQNLLCYQGGSATRSVTAARVRVRI